MKAFGAIAATEWPNSLALDAAPVREFLDAQGCCTVNEVGQIKIGGVVANDDIRI